MARPVQLSMAVDTRPHPPVPTSIGYPRRTVRDHSTRPARNAASGPQCIRSTARRWGEVINHTVHAFLLFALEPAPGGYTLYWGIYVKPVSRFTAFYMGLIDPFRRHLIYPRLIRRFEEVWLRRWEGTA